MLTTMQRIRILQRNLEYNHQFKKILKQKRYMLFLHRRSGYLPCFETLDRWRLLLIYFGVLSLSGNLMMFVNYNSFFDEHYFFYTSGSPAIMYCGVAMIFFVFAGMLDWCIYRRWGANHSLVFDFLVD